MGKKQTQALNSKAFIAWSSPEWLSQLCTKVDQQSDWTVEHHRCKVLRIPVGNIGYSQVVRTQSKESCSRILHIDGSTFASMTNMKYICNNQPSTRMHIHTRCTGTIGKCTCGTYKTRRLTSADKAASGMVPVKRELQMALERAMQHSYMSDCSSRHHDLGIIFFHIVCATRSMEIMLAEELAHRWCNLKHANLTSKLTNHDCLNMGLNNLYNCMETRGSIVVGRLKSSKEENALDLTALEAQRLLKVHQVICLQAGSLRSICITYPVPRSAYKNCPRKFWNWRKEQSVHKRRESTF